MPDRCTPEYERTLAEMGARLPYRRACTLLGNLFSLSEPPRVETVRQRTLQVGARLECQASAPLRSIPATEAKAITLAIDSGDVRSVRTYQVRSFEIIVVQASNDNGPTWAQYVSASTRRFHHMRRTAIVLGILEAA